MDLPVLRTMTSAEIIRESFRLYGETVSTVVVLALMAHLPLLALAGAMGESAPPNPGSVIGTLVAILVVNGIAVSAITLAVFAAIAGVPASMFTLLGWALRHSMLAVLAGYMLVNFVSHAGLLLFVIPGLLIGGLFAVTVPTILIERKGAIAGMGRSIAMLRQEWLKGIAVFAFGTFVAELLPLQVLLGMQYFVGRSPYSPLLAAVLGAITMPLALTAYVLLYVSLRSSDPETPPGVLRSQIERALPRDEPE